MKIDNNGLKSIKNFSLLIFVIFGSTLLFYISLNFLYIVSRLLRIDLISINYKDINSFESVFFLLINLSLFISGYGILRLKKWGLYVFSTSFIINLIAKVLFLFKQWKHLDAFPALGILIGLIIDIALLIYFIKVVKMSHRQFT